MKPRRKRVLRGLCCPVLRVLVRAVVIVRPDRRKLAIRVAGELRLRVRPGLRGTEQVCVRERDVSLRGIRKRPILRGGYNCVKQTAPTCGAGLAFEFGWRVCSFRWQLPDWVYKFRWSSVLRRLLRVVRRGQWWVACA